MSRRDEARAMAYDAMHDVILSTARMNGARLKISCQNIDGIDRDILAGAMDGIVSYAIASKPAHLPLDEFTAKIVTALQDILARRTLNLSTPANQRPV